MSSSNKDDKVPYAKIGFIEQLEGASFLPSDWTAFRIGVEGEGNCGLHAINYALNTYHYKTILHRGCPHSRPCSPHLNDQMKQLHDPVGKYTPYTTYVLRRISERTRHMIAHSFTPSTARCALRCFYERHEPENIHLSNQENTYTNVQETLRDMYQWISEIAFRQMSYILDIDILIYQFERNNFNCGYVSHNAGNHPIVMINWIGKRHFEAVAFVHNVDEQIERYEGDLTEVVYNHGVSRVDHDTTDPHIQELYRVLYETRAQQCARFFDPNAQCKANRPLPLELPTPKETNST